MHLMLKQMLNKEGSNNALLDSSAAYLAEDVNNHSRFKQVKRCKI